MLNFRCLQQNRRLVRDPAREAPTRLFHQILEDIAYGRATNDVRHFVVQAYARGAAVGCAENAELEGSTSVFTKRRSVNVCATRCD